MAYFLWDWNSRLELTWKPFCDQATFTSGSWAVSSGELWEMIENQSCLMKLKFFELSRYAILRIWWELKLTIVSFRQFRILTSRFCERGGRRICFHSWKSLPPRTCTNLFSNCSCSQELGKQVTHTWKKKFSWQILTIIKILSMSSDYLFWNNMSRQLKFFS